MWISDLSIRRPVLATMVIGALVLLGLVSLSRIGVDLFPRVEFPFVMVNTMLELTKLEQRQTSPQLETLHWASVFESFAPSAQSQFALHQLEFIAEPGNAAVRAEPLLLKLALSNLLENARAFAPAGTTITVQAQQGTVTVRDFGPGVPDYALPKLGERFFSTARPDGQTKGSGLGLAIVRQIMVLHGGTMVFSNAEPGLRVTLGFQHTSGPSIAKAR